MREINLGPVSNPDGTPSDTTIDMLAGTGRDPREFAGASSAAGTRARSFVATDPSALSQDALVEIARVVQDALYLDIDSTGDFYNPDKEWDSETLPFVAQVLDKHGLAPKEVS